MKAVRREFPLSVQKAIVLRATDPAGMVRCERCGAWCKTRKDYEIDHVISEGIRPAADKERRLKAADGQLLCAAVCHKSKTKADKGDIGQAKRREAKHAGLKAPGKVEIAQPKKKAKPELRVARGVVGMARRYR